MTRDEKPMLQIHANGVDLAQRYGRITAFEPGHAKPWHDALVDWWRFIRHREAVEIGRKIGRSISLDGDAA